MQNVDRSAASLVETFRSMQMEEEEEELPENGDVDYEVLMNYCPSKPI